MKSSPSRILFTGPLILASVLLAFTGCGRKPAPFAMPPPEVSTITVKTEKVVLENDLPGRTTAFLVAEVRPQVSGIIQKRLFNEGAEVKEGDLLYQIDPAVYQAKYDQAKAELAKAEARQIPAKSKYDRHTVLVGSNAISRQEFDNTKAELAATEADVVAAKAAVESTRINLEYTKITAPISGRIGKSQVTVGALVTSFHLQPLAVIQKFDPIFVDVTQSSVDFLKFKRSMTQGHVKSLMGKEAKVKLFFEDGSPYPIEGKLQFRDVTVDQNTGSYTLRIEFQNPDRALLPGMYVRAKIEEGVIEEAILISHQAVSRNMRGNPYVMLVDASGKVEMRDIVVERSIGNKWLVSSGLKDGERIIMEGLQKIRPGMQVTAVPFGTAPAQAPVTEPAKK